MRERACDPPGTANIQILPSSASAYGFDPRGAGTGGRISTQIRHFGPWPRHTICSNVLSSWLASPQCPPLISVEHANPPMAWNQSLDQHEDRSTARGHTRVAGVVIFVESFVVVVIAVLCGDDECFGSCHQGENVFFRSRSCLCGKSSLADAVLLSLLFM